MFYQRAPNDRQTGALASEGRLGEVNYTTWRFAGIFLEFNNHALKKIVKSYYIIDNLAPLFFWGGL